MFFFFSFHRPTIKPPGKVRGLFLRRLGQLARFSLYSISPSTFLLPAPDSFLQTPFLRGFRVVLSLVKKKGQYFPTSSRVPPVPPHRPRREEAPGGGGDRADRARIGEGGGIPTAASRVGEGILFPAPAPPRGQRGEPACGGERPPAGTGAGPGAGPPGRAGLLRSTARPNRAVRRPASTVVASPNTSL